MNWLFYAIIPEGHFPALKTSSKISTRNSCTDFTARISHPRFECQKPMSIGENPGPPIVQKPRNARLFVLDLWRTHYCCRTSASTYSTVARTETREKHDCGKGATDCHGRPW